MLLKSFKAKALYTVLVSVLLIGTTEAWKTAEHADAQAEQQMLFEKLLPGSTSFAVEMPGGIDETADPEVPGGAAEAVRSAYKGQTGYIVETVTPGFGGDIVLLVGVDNNGVVTGVEVQELHETQGYGSRAATDPFFTAQFVGTSGDAEIGENVDALSGATGTSKAVAQGVNAAVAYVAGEEIDSVNMDEMDGADIVSSATK